MSIIEITTQDEKKPTKYSVHSKEKEESRGRPEKKRTKEIRQAKFTHIHTKTTT